MDNLKNASPEFPIIRPTLVKLEEIEPYFREAWESGQITVGKFTAQFESSVAQKLGVRHTIAVSSCTSGLMLSIKALDLKGEVIVPSFTFAATVHALIWNDCVPVFVDSEPGTYNLDPSRIQPFINEKTSAIMPVYTFGLPPDLDELQEIARHYKLKVIYDSAQGLGSKYKNQWAGGFGDIEVFSLSPTKVVSSVEGGLVCTNNDELARRVRSMRDYGKAADGCDMEFIGLSARLSELHAIVGWRNFLRMEELVTARHVLIQQYKNELSGLQGISFQSELADRQSTGNYMVIFIQENVAGISRDELYDRLKSRGIQTKKYFYPAVHRQTAYRKHSRSREWQLPVAEKAAEDGLALPLYSHMTQSMLRTVCNRVKEALAQ